MANKPGVNIRVLQSELSAQAKTKIEPRIRRNIDARFNEYKKQMIEDFNNDPITKEINAGPYADSDFVDTNGHGGNLYSLLGFEAGTDPISDINDILENEITLSQSTDIKFRGEKIIVEKRVNIPTQKSIYERTEGLLEEWTQRSWLQLIQEGIPWFGSYLYDAFGFGDRSRSGPAIEAKDKTGKLVQVREGSFPGRAYLNKYLGALKAKISSTRRR